MPLRAITGRSLQSVLPETPKVGHCNTEAEGWVRVQTAGSGAAIEHSEEIGFAVGYYLAEGYLIHSRGRPSGVVFTRHRSESSYTNRAVDALLPFLSGRGRVSDREGTLTSQVHVYGAHLGVLVEENFGSLDEKRIPDYVFEWGAPFCAGLLRGLLCGDGSKKVPIVNGNTR